MKNQHIVEITIVWPDDNWSPGGENNYLLDSLKGVMAHLKRFPIEKKEYTMNLTNAFGRVYADVHVSPVTPITITPHPMFKLIRADEIAECWEGIPRELYRKLWSTIVPLQREIPNIEDSGPHDHIGHENIASHWDKLTREEQLHLNSLAKKLDEEFDKFRGNHETI